MGWSIIRTPIKSLISLLFIATATLFFITQWSGWYLDGAARGAAQASYAAIGKAVESGDAVYPAAAAADAVARSDAVAAVDRWYETPVYLTDPEMHCVRDLARERLFQLAAFEGTLLSADLTEGSSGSPATRRTCASRWSGSWPGRRFPSPRGDAVTVYSDSLDRVEAFCAAEELRPGEPFLVVASPTTDPNRARRYPLTLTKGPAYEGLVYPLSDAPEDYLEHEPFITYAADLRGHGGTGYISSASGLGADILAYRRHMQTLDGIFAEDLRADPRFAGGETSLAAGRLITAADAAAPACMVSEDFARLWGLSVGDPLPLAVGTHPYYTYPPGGKRPDHIAELLLPQDIQSEPLAPEIVGIFAIQTAGTSADSPTANTVYLSVGCWPEDLFREQWGWGAYYGAEGGMDRLLDTEHFSFRLKDPGDVALFLRETEPALAALGYLLAVDDNGYSRVRDVLRGRGPPWRGL